MTADPMIPGVLGRIIARKRQEIAEEKSQSPLDRLRRQCRDLPPARGFARALRRHRAPAIIAELKYASPSRGAIRAKLDPAADARSYRDHGAACLSVLTERKWFGGDLADLRSVRDHVDLPLLRKDFIVDPWQVYQSRQAGADAILLILAALAPPRSRELADLARELGMDVLVEVHDAAELRWARELPIDLIGINNRNLKTLKVDLNVSRELLPTLRGHGALRICESGLGSGADLLRMHRHGAEAFLVGEALMSREDPGAALGAWIGEFARAAKA